jgi:hypothetical protein
MVPLPTVREFIARATGEFGATLHTARDRMMGPRGPVTFQYLVREPSCFAILPGLEPDDVLMPDVLRSLCEQLAIAPAEFGLDLTE